MNYILHFTQKVASGETRIIETKMYFLLCLKKLCSDSGMSQSCCILGQVWTVGLLTSQFQPGVHGGGSFGIGHAVAPVWGSNSSWSHGSDNWRSGWRTNGAHPPATDHQVHWGHRSPNSVASHAANFQWPVGSLAVQID